MLIYSLGALSALILWAVASYLDYVRGLEVNLGDYLITGIILSLFSWFAFIVLFGLILSDLLDKLVYSVGKIKFKRNNK